MIKPLRDNIACVPLEEITKVGSLFLPENKRQYLLQHRKMLVVYAGKDAVSQGCPSGTVVHAKETFGDEIIHKGRKMWIGRLRDVNGICEGERVPDAAKYNS